MKKVFKFCRYLRKSDHFFRVNSIKWFVTALFFTIASFSLSGQVISRELSNIKYVSRDLSVTPNEITLEPFFPGIAYDFTIPLINEASRALINFVIQTSSDYDGIVVENEGLGTGSFTIPSTCIPISIDSKIEIIVDANNIDLPDPPDQVKYIIPFSHSSVKVALVLDISGSMYEYAATTTESRWSVLTRAVKGFADMFEQYHAPGDLGSLTYFTTDTVQPGAPIFKEFIPISPEDQFSIKITNDMSRKHPLLRTAMGLGLLDGKYKLKLNGDALKKSVVLFTDGMQNVYPLVLDGGNALEGGFFLNDIPTTDPIKYYTIGIEAFGYNPQILVNIASASDGIYHLTNGGNDWSDFFEDILTKILSGSSPQIVFREYGTYESGESIQEFSLNDNVEKIVFRLTFPANSGLKMSVEKDGIDLTPPADKVISGDFYQQINISFPVKVNTSYIQSGGKWRVKMTGKQNADYRIVGIADDHFLKFKCELNKSLFTVGDTLHMAVNLKYAGNPLTDASNTIIALVLKPGEDIGDLLARTQTPVLNDTLDFTSDAQQKFLHLLQADTAFFNALLPTKRVIQLTHTGEGIYKGQFDSTDFTGIYKIYFLLNGTIPGKGTLQRLELKDALFKFGQLDTDESDISVTVDTTTSTTTIPGTTTATITVRPVNKYKKYLGPGFDTQIKVSIKDRPFSFKPKWIPVQLFRTKTKSAVVNDSIQVREIKDNLDGSYNIVLVNIPKNSDPFLKVTIMGEVLKKARLSQFCHKGWSDCIWIIIISILIIILFILRYFRNMGVIYRLPQWLMWFLVLIWLIIIILQKAGLITLLSSSCF